MEEDFVIASLMTGRCAAAISNIQVVGDGADKVIGGIFRPVKNKRLDLGKGNSLLGHIVDGDKVIDEVIVGCEEEDSFGINCHGNPLIVEMIMELLQSRGVRLVEPGEILLLAAKRKYGDDAIAIEAEVAMPGAATLAGAKIISHQVKMGLKQTAKWWVENVETLGIEDIREGAEYVLKDSLVAKLIVDGGKVVLAGPVNSGKSTLFNKLCGKENAIVTDAAGTTRDWISARVKLEGVTVEMVDTAGLDEVLGASSQIDAESQKRGIGLLDSADLVLQVFDASKKSEIEVLKNGNVLVVLNKSDLGVKVDGAEFADSVKISAKLGEGVDILVERIRQKLGVADFDIKKTVCFTARQRELIGGIANGTSKKQIVELTGELLNGRVCV